MGQSPDTAASLSTLRVRDPFVLADAASQTYYLCASLAPTGDGSRPGVGVYTSRDLQVWRGPSRILEIDEDFWAQGRIWAPEMHLYLGKVYLFLTCNSDVPLPGSDLSPDGWPPRVKRGTQVLVADSPLGPFRAFHNRAHTPADQMALDGTLWVEDDVPYMVYCHEWVEIADGTVDLVRLEDDLSDVVGDPVTLFRGSDALWAHPGRDRYITDGPYLYRTVRGRLLMLWSTFGRHGYATLIAASESGSIYGPWHQLPTPLFAEDGGHAMVFHTFDGTPMLALHHPNQSPYERALLFELVETVDASGETLSIVCQSPASLGSA